MNWFGGRLAVITKNGGSFYPDLTLEQAIETLKQDYGHDPSLVKEAMYHPYPTDLKAHLLED